MTNKKNTVLIVEDENDLRRLIKDKLISGGFDVLEAADGKIGLEMALSHRPDVILLDVIMPVMGGLPMLRELRQDEYGRNVPVIILSNLERTKAVGESLDKSFQDYYIKSDISLTDIVKIVEGKIKGQK